MATEALTQYKLMILYLLHSVKYPLSNSRLSGFFLDNEYTTYFTLQQCINDLVEASLISAEHSQSTTRYEITEEGNQTLNFFSQDIPELVREDIDLFLSKNKSRLQSEAALYSDYSETDTKEYLVQLESRENRTRLCRVELTVPDEESAKALCLKWEAKHQKVYTYLLQEFLGEE